jgi:hypothetical protein
VETLRTAVLHRAPGMDVHQVDLPLLHLFSQDIVPVVVLV